MPKRNLAASRLYILMFDYLQDLNQSVQLVSESCIDHLNNFHSQPSKEYLRMSGEIERKISTYISQVTEGISTSSFMDNNKIIDQFDIISSIIGKSIDHVITEIQKNEVGIRIGQLQIKLLLETKDMLSTIQNIYLLYHDYHKQDK
jgi:hypothetical protein